MGKEIGTGSIKIKYFLPSRSLRSGRNNVITLNLNFCINQTNAVKIRRKQEKGVKKVFNIMFL